MNGLRSYWMEEEFYDGWKFYGYVYKTGEEGNNILFEISCYVSNATVSVVVERYKNLTFTCLRVFEEVIREYGERLSIEEVDGFHFGQKFLREKGVSVTYSLWNKLCLKIGNRIANALQTFCLNAQKFVDDISEVVSQRAQNDVKRFLDYWCKAENVCKIPYEAVSSIKSDIERYLKERESKEASNAYKALNSIHQEVENYAGSLREKLVSKLNEMAKA